jgi:hypothetical protein
VVALLVIVLVQLKMEEIMVAVSVVRQALQVVRVAL